MFWGCTSVRYRCDPARAKRHLDRKSGAHRAAELLPVRTRLTWNGPKFASHHIFRDDRRADSDTRRAPRATRAGRHGNRGRRGPRIHPTRRGRRRRRANPTERPRRRP